MHHYLSGWAICFFIIGLILHAAAQIDAIARSKNNPQTSRLAILRTRWIAILIRGAWCLALFILWLQGQLVEVLTAINVPLPDTAAKILGLQVSAPIAFMAGYAFDSALGYVPWLKSSVPPPIDQTSIPAGTP
jgi:hypothetical protein